MKWRSDIIPKIFERYSFSLILRLQSPSNVMMIAHYLNQSISEFQSNIGFVCTKQQLFTSPHHNQGSQTSSMGVRLRQWVVDWLNRIRSNWEQTTQHKGVEVSVPLSHPNLCRSFNSLEPSTKSMNYLYDCQKLNLLHMLVEYIYIISFFSIFCFLNLNKLLMSLSVVTTIHVICQ